MDSLLLDEKPTNSVETQDTENQIYCWWTPDGKRLTFKTFRQAARVIASISAHHERERILAEANANAHINQVGSELMVRRWTWLCKIIGHHWDSHNDLCGQWDCKRCGKIKPPIKCPPPPPLRKICSLEKVEG